MTNKYKNKQEYIIASILKEGGDPNEKIDRKCGKPFGDGCQCYANEPWINLDKKPEDLSDEDIKHLLTVFKVRENINAIMKSVGKITGIASQIRNDIKLFEKGEKEIDRIKLGEDIDLLRKTKHELRSNLVTLKFGKFQELITGKVENYRLDRPTNQKQRKPNYSNMNTKNINADKQIN